MAAGFQGLKKPNVGGLGVGVRPTAANISGPSGFHPSVEAQGLMVHQNAPIIKDKAEMLQLQEQYDTQEALRQKNLAKLSELRGTPDLNAGARAPGSQQIGVNKGKVTPYSGLGPAQRKKDALESPYFQGLY